MMKIGAVLTDDGEIELNEGRSRTSVTVTNTGDRPIQVGSHFHFFEVNRALQFDRASAFGYRLNVPAGSAVRFEPGDTRRVELVALAGTRRVIGLNRLTEGSVDSSGTRSRALQQFVGAGENSPEEGTRT